MKAVINSDVNMGVVGSPLVGKCTKNVENDVFAVLINCRAQINADKR